MKEVLNIAMKCRSCAKAKCQSACPLEQDIPLITKLIKNNQFNEAKDILFMHNPFGYVTSSLCNHEKQCAGNCIFHDVDFFKLENSLSKQYFNELISYPPTLETRPIAIIGGGIAGLTMAHMLLKQGIKPTIFEKDQLGGVIVKAIPDFRFDKSLFLKHISKIASLSNVVYEEITVESLDKLDEFNHLIFTTGAPIESSALEGENVLRGINVLHAFNEQKLNVVNKKVAVIGLGNTACDVARALKRANNDVSIIYRRDIDSSPATSKELASLKEEEIVIKQCLSPVSYFNSTLRMQKNELVEVEGSKRKNIIPTNIFEEEKFDFVVEALGSKVNDNLLKALLEEDYLTLQAVRKNEPNKRSFTLTSHNKLVSVIGDAYYGAWNIAQAINSSLEVVKKHYPTYLFGGSFNPITKAHVKIIDYLSSLGNLIIVPNGDKYNLKDLMSFDHRKKMIEIELRKLKYQGRISISDFEKSTLYKGSIETLRYYNHPVMVIGDDCLLTLHKWINASKLVEENNFVVITRKHSKESLEKYIQEQEILTQYQDHFTIVELLEESVRNISSSSYRYENNQDALSEEVIDYIKNNKLYEV